MVANYAATSLFRIGQKVALARSNWCICGRWAGHVFGSMKSSGPLFMEAMDKRTGCVGTNSVLRKKC